MWISICVCLLPSRHNSPSRTPARLHIVMASFIKTAVWLGRAWTQTAWRRFQPSAVMRLPRAHVSGAPHKLRSLLPGRDSERCAGVYWVKFCVVCMTDNVLLKDIFFYVINLIFSHCARLWYFMFVSFIFFHRVINLSWKIIPSQLHVWINNYFWFRKKNMK